MNRLFRSAIVMSAAAALVLSGCDRDDTEPDDTGTGTSTGSATTSAPDGGEVTEDPTETQTSSEPEVELETLYPAPADAARTFPEPLASQQNSETGDEVTLTGVHRLAEDRVVVTGLVTFEDRSNADFYITNFEEPGFRDLANGGELGRLELTVDGDEATYLPVRDDHDRCLCTVLRPGFQSAGEPLAFMAVLSAPADAESVTINLEGFGEYPDLTVTDLPSATSSPWGLHQTLSVQQASRDAGLVTARVRIATPETTEGFGLGVYQFGQAQRCFYGLTAVSGSKGTWTEDGCFSGNLPPDGQAIDIEVSFPDPGTEDVVFLPWNGSPMVVPVEGDPVEGTDEVVRTYAFRTLTDGATVTQGEELQVSLDTSVLFDFDESTLTAEAQDTLAVAVEALQAQDGRALTIDGHTDTQGDAAYNKDLSLARAEAVRDALADLLGDGWTFTVNGYGEEQTLVDERGTPEEIEAAQARNRRVEITINN